MGQHAAKLVLVVAAGAHGGCSLIYNPNNLPATADAPIDVRPTVRENLILTGSSPSFVLEGQGDGGSQPALLVIRGSDIAPDATVEIVPATEAMVTVTVGTPTVASNTKLLAVPLILPVDPMLGDDVPLTIKVTQPLEGGGTVTQELTDTLTWRGLKELTDASLVLTGGVALSQQLEDQYSKIELSSTVWSGTARVALRATSSITLGDVAANGGNASAATAGGPGPGGCGGGGPAARGQCEGGGGPGGSGTLNSGGGGGGGFSSEGTPGGGTGGGSAGAQVGSPTVPNFDAFEGRPPNRAAGGGGGGNIVAGSGAGGGGGGGTVEVTAGGDVQTGAISAVGGNGGVIALQGSGGGGAGGLVLVRGGGTLTVGAINVRGGAGGATAPAGGAGSGGRVRWDVPGADAVAPTVTGVTPHRGPAFAVEPAIFTRADATFSLFGTTDDEFDIYVVDEAGDVHIGSTGKFSGGRANITPRLFEGWNRVCITLSGGPRGKSEADKCVEAVYLP